MQVFSLLDRCAWQIILDNVFRGRARHRHRAARRQDWTRPGCETLEDRLAPATITFPVPNGSFYFGRAVALSGNNVLVGTYLANGDKGAAYLYNTAGTLLQTFNDPGNTKVDQFGDSVALSGNDVLVGAYGTDSYNGAAYLYTGETGEISALFGNNQSTTVGTAFGTALEAQATDAYGNPFPGASVTFTVTDGPSGAGASFAGDTTATVTTNLDGLAIAPVLTAKDVAGSFTVTADCDGISATFLLTNTNGAPDHIAPFGGTPQSTVEGSTFRTLLQALVTDSHGNPVADASVTFTAPSSAASGTFDAYATVPTNALGIATAPAFTANDIAGTFAVTATAAGVAAPARFTLTNTRPAKRTWTTVVGPQITELYREFLPYYNARAVASFVPSNDLVALNVANGEVAIAVLAFVDTSSPIIKLGGQVTAVRYLPVAFGMPGIEVDALFPIIKLPALGNLADVVIVNAQDRVGDPGNIAPSITANPQDRMVLPGLEVTFTAAATGMLAAIVQWQVSSDGGEIFVNIPGADSTTFAFTLSITEDGDEFRAVFSNELGQVSTRAARLLIHLSPGSYR